MIGHLVQTDLEQLIQAQDWESLRQILAALTDQDVAELLIDLPEHDEGVIFRLLPRERAAQVFSYLSEIFSTDSGARSEEARLSA